MDHRVRVGRVGVEAWPRTIQPALRCGSTPWPTSSTRAWRMKSPVSLFQAKWNSSRGLPTLAPAAESPYSWEAAL